MDSYYNFITINGKDVKLDKEKIFTTLVEYSKLVEEVYFITTNIEYFKIEVN